MAEKTFLKDYQKKLLKKKNVIAVGLGYKTIAGEKTSIWAIVCSVRNKVPIEQLKKEDVVPKEVEGLPTDVIEVGEIVAFKARTDRWRPSPGGVSIGHEWITAGTLGCLVRKNNEIFILSNNHVLADSNNAPIGSAILQPGKYDGGGLIDRIATLSEFVPIKFQGEEGCNVGKLISSLLSFGAKTIHSKTRIMAIAEQEENLADAAIAEPVSDDVVLDEILDVGKIAGLNTAIQVSEGVQKSGRTTALTKNTLEQVDVASLVQYGEGKTALFVKQFMAGAMCAGGDSGSVVLDMERRLVGLLFAGSEKVTVINPIKYVFELLGCDLP